MHRKPFSKVLSGRKKCPLGVPFLALVVAIATKARLTKCAAEGVPTAKKSLRQMTQDGQLSITMNGVNHKVSQEYILEGQSGRFDSYELSNEGSDIALEGNTLLVFRVPAYKLQDTTILTFDFSVREEASLHAICLKNAIDGKGQIYAKNGQLVTNRCFRLSGTDVPATSNVRDFTLERTAEGNSRSYRLQVGHFMQTWLRHIVFVSTSPRKKRGDVSFGNINIFENPSPVRLTLTIQGSATTVDGPPVSYRQDLDKSGTNAYGISIGGERLTLRGNVWKAFPIGKYFVTKNTVLQFSFSLLKEVNFHAICLVEDVDPAFFNGQGCFRVAGDQGQDDLLQLVSLAPTLEGNTREYEVNVGEHFLGDVTYLVFISDSLDDRSTGEAVFESIALYEGMPNLIVTLNNQVQEAGDPLSFGDIKRGSLDEEYSISADGSEITLHGVTSNSFPIPTFEVKDNSILEFSFRVLTEAGAHAICLDSDLEAEDTSANGLQGHCFYLAGRLGGSAANVGRNYYLKPTAEGERERYRIEVGHYFLGEIKYITFISDAAFNPATIGIVSFNGIHLYDDDSALRLSIQLKKSWNQELKAPVSYGDSDNFRDTSGVNQYEISSDSKEITLRGNAWKAFPLNYFVKAKTVLSFDFTLFEETRVHAICLDNDLNHTTVQGVTEKGNIKTEERVADRCFWIAGYGTRCSTRTVDSGGTNDLLRSTCWPFEATSGITQLEGEGVHYRINVGDFYRGHVGYLALINGARKANKAEGEATFSNLKIYNE